VPFSVITPQEEERKALEMLRLAAAVEAEREKEQEKEQAARGPLSKAETQLQASSKQASGEREAVF
jgi:hypothetical protein